MVNWKAANVASGVFSVLTFIITAILFVMYLTKQADVQAAAASVASRVSNAAQNVANNANSFANAYGPAQPAQQFIYPQNAQSTGSPIPVGIDPYTGQPVKGGAEISNGTIAALALLGISLVFHGIIWGLTFGQAKNGYNDD